MRQFIAGVAAGIAIGYGASLAREYARVYVSKRKQPWTETDSPNVVPFRDRVQTYGEPVGSATIRTAVIRPRKRPDSDPTPAGPR